MADCAITSFDCLSAYGMNLEGVGKELVSIIMATIKMERIQRTRNDLHPLEVIQEQAELDLLLFPVLRGRPLFGDCQLKEGFTELKDVGLPIPLFIPTFVVIGVV